MRLVLLSVLACFAFVACKHGNAKEDINGETSGKTTELRLVQDEGAGTISVYHSDGQTPLLVQNAKPDFRPYIHPLTAPDGNGVLTEYSPDHHKHQTGIYWGFTNVNGRDYFHHPGDGYWKKNSAFIVQEKGEQVKWQTIYDLLDEKGNTVLTETQSWTMRVDSGRYIISLEWKGDAKTDVTIGKYDYGGLFVRMPWKEGIKGEVVNQVRQRNQNAEGQRAMWVDVGMQVQDREDLAHITIFDHPENRGYPMHWRVDQQLGIGPAPSREEDRKIANGESLVFKHQLYVYTGELNDLALSDQYNAFAGNNSMYSQSEMWQIAKQEGLQAKFLTPEEAVKAMTIRDGYKVNIWAAEPMMTQPMAFCWDDRGRMWIAENRDYESRGHGFSNAGDSRIIILEDTNRDGTADTRKIFLDNIAFPAALAVGFDGVFVGAPPNLLFVPDRNRDDKAEVKDIEVRLTGWGIRDRHETLNSFHWGPDGWLYGLQGFATPSKVRKPTGKGKLYKHKEPFPEDILEGEGTDINGGVWRYHPTKDRFEVVAHGFSNPWGIDYDANGQMFISACVIPHMWHVIPGGIYHRQGGQHFNPYVYDDIKTITNHSHRSAHGGARIYQSDAFPEDQRGRIFMANIHEHAVLTDILTPKGSGFVASHGDDFMMANNAQWVGFSMEIGPDGNVYALDWHDADICGQAVLNSETGRVFRIAPQNTLAQDWPGRFDDLSKLTDKQLVQLQTSISDWHARHARVILQSRAAKGNLDKTVYNDLLNLFNTSQSNDHRLRAMWALHVAGGISPETLIDALGDKNEHVRSWAIQLLCEDKKPPKVAAEEFVRMAQNDPSPTVRLYLSSALQRMDKEGAWKIAAELVKHGEDNEDHNLPKMVWFGFEPLASQDIGRALQVGATSKIPFIAKNTARRAVDAGALDLLVKTIDAQPATLNHLLEGMISGMEGRVDLKAPASWPAVLAKIQKRGGRSEQLANDIAALFGDTEAAQRLLATLQNKNAPLEQRKKALLALSAKEGIDT
jgi:putative membrane-bound dehydrogenase-like protein